MRRNQRKAMRRCGGARLSNFAKQAELGVVRAVIIEYRRAVANGNILGARCR